MNVNVPFELQLVRLGVLAAAMALVGGVALSGLFAQLLDRLKYRSIRTWERRVSRAAFACVAAGLGAFTWGVTVESRWVEITHHDLTTDRLPAGQRLRIVHLSDLHVDGPDGPWSGLAQTVNDLAPDLVVFTGDSLNAAAGLDTFRATLAGMHPRLGVFAVRGNHDTSYWTNTDLFGGGVAHELNGPVPALVADGRVALCGAAYGVGGNLAACVAASGDAYRILAYHTPDLVEDFGADGPDLYLGGHTHGGQVRLPFYGALITLSRFDKKYESGLSRFGTTTINVNRGIGTVPGAPPVRFLCRPEVTVLDVLGTGAPASP